MTKTQKIMSEQNSQREEEYQREQQELAEMHQRAIEGEQQ